MCGIVGVAATRDVAQIIVNGLKALEYRGYDSAGIAVVRDRQLQVCKERGKVAALQASVSKRSFLGHCGIGHTRWATHGKPSVRNAHPHVSHDEIAVVHNGIIENNDELKLSLKNDGYNFNSQTDTETIAHLVHRFMASGALFPEACLQAIELLKGSYAVAITSTNEPGKIIAARKGSPLVIGAGRNEYYVASDIPAIMTEVSQYYFLEEGDIAEITANSCSIYDLSGKNVDRPLHDVKQDDRVVTKAQYAHYMLKEIHEQDDVVRRCISDVIRKQSLVQCIFPTELAGFLKRSRFLHIVACGSSWHAAYIAKYWFESIADVVCQVEIASEYRYREMVVPPNSVFIAVSQSGETADTLAALRYAKASTYDAVLSVCNVKSSAMYRESDFTLLTKAGIEVGVASTKALTAQLTMLALICLQTAQLKSVNQNKFHAALTQLENLPSAITRTLQLEPQIIAMAKALNTYDNILYIGRGAHFPVALEAALKMKEISYIHAEAYAAGELKHGPLALIDSHVPVIAACPCNRLLEKVKSNLEEVRSRGGQLFVVTDDEMQSAVCSKEAFRLSIPSVGSFVSPILYNVPLQLLAYHVARLRGTDIDQPRNLAKSVTVE